MRILILNPIGNIGGAERVLLTALAGLRQELPDVVIRVIAFAEGPLLVAARQHGAEVEVVQLPAGLADLGDSRGAGNGKFLLVNLVIRIPAMLTFLSRLRARVVNFSPDLVHSNGIKTHLVSWFAVPAGVPVVWHVHDFYGRRPLAGWLLRRVRSRVRLLVAISSPVAVDASAILPGVPVKIVPNAVDVGRFAPGPGDGDELDRRAGLPPAPVGTVRVGLVATYARWKGHNTVLEAASLLAAESSTLPVRWYIVGGPIYQTTAQFTVTELQKATAARGLSGRVGFVPFTDNPVPIYRSLDVVLHASTQPEPFGLTVVEAMACGRAVVVSADGGAAELFSAGIDALGFTPGDVNQLVTAVRRLIEDPELRASLGETARRTALARFDANHYGERLLAAYRTIPRIRL
jgi:glycosyltransferase involved in cell wall biosynthesis